MRRKITKCVIICLAGMIMMGAGKLTGLSPKKVLSNYLDATFKRNHEEAYTYISSKDTAVKSLESYLNEKSNKDDPFYQMMAGKISYKIINFEEYERNVTADVEITLPNLRPILFDLMITGFKVAFGEGDKKENGKKMGKALATHFENNEIPMMTNNDTFRLIQEDEKWKVFLDWETKIIKKKQQEKITLLLNQAYELRKSKKFHKAIEKYKQALEFDSEMFSAKIGLEATQNEIKALEEEKAYITHKQQQKKTLLLLKQQQKKISLLLKQAQKLKSDEKFHEAIKKYKQILDLDSEIVDAKTGIKETQNEIKALYEKKVYIKNIELYDIKVAYYTTYLEERVPGVKFKLKNKGNRTLKKIEVTVYFKDANDTIISEENYHPVSEYSFSGNNKPLKPNYIWQMERDGFYRADSVPSEWNEGAFSAKITNIEFE